MARAWLFCAAVCLCAVLHGADKATFDVHSAAMGRAVKVSVVTPDGYGADSVSRWPAVYFLHGAGNDHTTYLRQEIFDCVDAGRFIAVMPDGGGDWWMDSPVLPNARRETFVVKELVSWVDSHFRTFAMKGKRALAGHSMGGQGAARLGMRHPDLFGAVANVMGGVDICSCASRKDIVRMLGKYEVNKERWREFSVLAEAEKLQPGMLRIFSIVGTDDFFLKQNRALHQLLSKRKIAHEYTEVRGDTDEMSKHSRPFAIWGLARLCRQLADFFAETVPPPPVRELVKTGAEMRVCEGEEASLSPDGSRLVLQRLVDGRRIVLVRELATGRERTVSPDEGQACHPEWGADGSVLYTCGNETKTGFAARNDDTGWNLWIWKNGERRQITHGRQRAYTASFSPDGRTIYFACDRVKAPESEASNPLAISRVGIAAVGIEGGAQRTVCILPESNTACCEPRVSPDGTKLLRAELRKFREPWRLVVSPIDRPDRRTYLTTLYEAAYAPVWSPDGRLIAYTGFRDGDGGWGVYVMPATGGSVQRIADGRNPTFAPDGRSVFYDRDGSIYRRGVMP